jgi:Acyclic terpene utilisation family protein AtuA
MNSEKTIRVANAQGFWGDSALGPRRLVEEGPVDYLTFDYLAEITMSIMQKQKMRNPQAGYASDFVSMLAGILPTCQEKGIKIIANAGGVNLKACLVAIKKMISELGLNGIKIGIVEGDDILDKLPNLMATGETFENLETGESIDSIFKQINSANVYIGAAPIVEALRQGADIVVTGRASDPSLVLAPLMYEFGWQEDDYDKMAAGTVMGHIIECGPQCTGGNYTHWRDVPNPARIGYPVIEANADGSFVVTKHENTGGLITVDTVSSQLLYELGDPENYLSPDCIADFTTIEIEQQADNRVAIGAIKGKPATPSYKVSMAYADGYKTLSTLSIAGPDAVDKAKLMASMVFERMEMHGVAIAEENQFLELFGTNVLYKGVVPSNEQPFELLMRIGAKSHDKKALAVFAAEIAPLLTSGPPGVTGFAGGRSRPTEIVGYWPALIDKTNVFTHVTVEAV